MLYNVPVIKNPTRGKEGKMTRIGILNPNSKNRRYLSDEELSPVTLPEIDIARIAVECQEQILRAIPEGFPDFLAETKARLASARAHLAELETMKHSTSDFTARLQDDDDAILAHIDSLVGTERLTIAQMDDAIELFTTQSYKDKHVPDKTCPKCGGLLIVKERRRFIHSTGGYDITPFVACAMWDRTGCRHKEEFTAEIKKAIDCAVSMVDLELGI